MRVLIGTLFAVLLLASPAFAQHPCDVASPPSVSTKSPFTVGACFSNKDVDGNPSPITALKVFIDGVLVKTQAAPPAVGAPNAAGLSYYTTTGVAASKGARVLTVTVVTADGESDPSTAYNFSVVGGKPGKPVGPRVVSN